jgi:hypothetical protein
VRAGERGRSKNREVKPIKGMRWGKGSDKKRRKEEEKNG